MRIADRRLRSLLGTYAPLLQPGAGDELRGELRWLGRSLSPGRDAQVLRDRLQVMLAELPPELVIGPVARRIAVELTAAQREGMAQARAALDSERYFRLLDALDGFIAHPPVTAKAGRKAAKTVPALWERDTGRLRRATKQARKAPDGERDERLHDVRKRAKRLRYAAQSAAPVSPARARRLAKRAKRVQQSLGLHQDAVVAKGALRRYAVEAHLSGENAFTYGLLHGLADQMATEAEARFFGGWPAA